MAGHSRWANIEHRKGAQDARKGRTFTRLIRITLGGDDAGKMWTPLEALEDLDDVRPVYSNAGFPDAFVQQHAAA